MTVTRHWLRGRRSFHSLTERDDEPREAGYQRLSGGDGGLHNACTAEERHDRGARGILSSERGPGNGARPALCVQARDSGTSGCAAVLQAPIDGGKALCARKNDSIVQLQALASRSFS